MPVPDNATACGLLAALSVKVSVPVAAPKTVGAKVTSTLPFAPAASVVPQVFEKIAKLPLTVMLLMVSEVAPVLVTVTVLAVLVLSMTSLPKLSELGVTARVELFTCCVNTDELLPRKLVSPRSERSRRVRASEARPLFRAGGGEQPSCARPTGKSARPHTR